MPSKYLAILFDIDGTLIISGGAGAASWRMAFDHIYGIPADIGQYSLVSREPALCRERSAGSNRVAGPVPDHGIGPGDGTWSWVACVVVHRLVGEMSGIG